MEPSSLKEALVHHWQYQKWANTLILDALDRLSEQELVRECGVSHKSIRGTLNHIYLADQIWYARLSGLGTITMAQIPVPVSLSELRNNWSTVLDLYVSLARSSDDFERQINYQRDGNTFSTPLWQILLHVVNHDSLHRGQIMAMLRQMGVTPPSTDLIYYYRQIARAAAA